MNTSSPQFSKLTQSDVKDFYDTFSEVIRSEFPGYTPKVVEYLLSKIYSRYAYEYWIRNNLKTVVIAKVNNEIVGFADIDNPYGGVSLLRRLGVKKEHQRAGIGSKLIKAWEELARTQHAHKMEVAAQPEAKEFYAKMGLKLEGMREKSFFGINQYIFGKILSDPSDEGITK